MSTLLGVLGLALYIVAVISLAAGVTALVIKISPAQSTKQAKAARAKG